MKLYYSKGACSLAVRIVIHEIQIPCVFESVDLKTKITETGADFLKIAPKGAVPVLLLDNQEILSENAVIQQYLADEFKAVHLLPGLGDFRRYRALEWLNFVSSELHKSCGALFNPKIPVDLKETVFKPLLKTKLNIVNQRLHENQYLANDQFSLADGYLFVVLSWLRLFNLEMSEWSALDRYYSALKARPSIRRSLEEEGLIF